MPHRRRGVRLRVPPSRARTGVLLGSAAVVGTLTLAWLVAWIPRRDPRCLAVCGDNPLGLGIDDGLARTLASASQVTTLLLAVGLASWAGRYLSLASPRARRRDRGLLVPAIAVGVAWALWAVALLAPSGSRPTGRRHRGPGVRHPSRAATLLAGGLVSRTLDEQRLRAAIRKVAARLSPPPGRGTLRALVGDAFGDPGLQLLFALPGGGTPCRRRRTTSRPATRRSDPGASHRDPWLLTVSSPSPSMHRWSGACRHPIWAMRCSWPSTMSGCLRASGTRCWSFERHGHASSMRATRLVAGSSVTCTTERNSGCWACCTSWRSARSAAAGAGVPDVTARLEGAIADTVATLEALRRLARGIHPAVLTEAGLSAALEALADRAPLPIVARASRRIAVCTRHRSGSVPSGFAARGARARRRRGRGTRSASPSARAGCA